MFGRGWSGKRGRGWLPELVTNLANRHAVRCSMPFHVLLACMAYTQYAQINVNLEALQAALSPSPFSERVEPAFNKTEMKLNIPQLLTKCQV